MACYAFDWLQVGKGTRLTARRLAVWTSLLFLLSATHNSLAVLQCAQDEHDRDAR